MSGFGYNLASESVSLFQAHEKQVLGVIAQKNASVERLADEMEIIEAFLSEVAKRTADSKRLSFLTKEDQDLIDRMRECKGLAHAFPHGQYEWKGPEITNLQQRLFQHVEGPLRTQIDKLQKEILLEHHELNKATELFSRGLHRMTALITNILNNAKRQM